MADDDDDDEDDVKSLRSNHFVTVSPGLYLFFAFLAKGGMNITKLHESGSCRWCSLAGFICMCFFFSFYDKQVDS